MATARITLSKSTAVSGQTVDGQVLISNNGDAAITVSTVSVFTVDRNISPSATRINVDLGAGGGGAGASPVVQTVINSGSSYSYPFTAQAFGARAPGATSVPIQFGGCVTLSDNTQIGAQPHTLWLVPALQATADTVNTQVNNLTNNPAVVLDTSHAGHTDFEYPQTSGLIAAIPLV